MEQRCPTCGALCIEGQPLTPVPSPHEIAATMREWAEIIKDSHPFDFADTLRAYADKLEAASVGATLTEPPLEYETEHPWTAFNEWHKIEHEIHGYLWPCPKPLRCLWRYTRKTNAHLDQQGQPASPTLRAGDSSPTLAELVTPEEAGEIWRWSGDLCEHTPFRQCLDCGGKTGPITLSRAHPYCAAFWQRAKERG